MDLSQHIIEKFKCFFKKNWGLSFNPVGVLDNFQVPSSLLASRLISSSMQPISSLMMLISCYTS
jgi:hypothetical protein